MNLSDREKEILDTLYQMDGDREKVVDTLCIADTTFKTHLNRIASKLKARSTLAAMILYLKNK